MPKAKPVNYDYFLSWATGYFGYDNVKPSGPEICVNSPFVPHYDPDDGHHLWCRPDEGCFHCWKTGARGTLTRLVMDMEGCPPEDAADILGGSQHLAELHQKLVKFFESKAADQQKPVVESGKALLSLPPETHLISELEGWHRKQAEDYLKGRRLPIEGLYYCVGGKYKQRIVIPYYGPDGQLIYWNGRDITNRHKLRYWGPGKETGVGKGDVLWMSGWPKAGSTIYLCEGEFDAMSLARAGLTGAACGGKEFGEKQLDLVKSYQLTICFDMDKYGLEALNKVGAFMRDNQFVGGAKYGRMGYVRPAKSYKDWNDMLVQLGEEVLGLYIGRSEKALSWGDISRMRFNAM